MWVPTSFKCAGLGGGVSMDWNRTLPPTPKKPKAPSLRRWALALLTIGGLWAIFLTRYSALVKPVDHGLWVPCFLLALAMVAVLGLRLGIYLMQLGYFDELQCHAANAERALKTWAHRHLAVVASCTVLPDGVSASALLVDQQAFKPRTGTARRLAKLPEGNVARASLAQQRLLTAMLPAIRALPPSHRLNVTLLTDTDINEQAALTHAWQESWQHSMPSLPSATLCMTRTLSYQWIEEKLDAASPAAELILVVQVCGGAAYSDGLAAMLIGAGTVAQSQGLPIIAKLHRPMPFAADTVETAFASFIRAQALAQGAVGVLTEQADGNVLIDRLMAADPAFSPRQRWNRESLCGVSGPCGHWLLMALGAEMARHRQPLVALAQEGSHRWINTVSGA